MLYETYIKGNYQVIKIIEALNFTSEINELENIINGFLEKNIINIAIHFNDDSFLYSDTVTVLMRCWKAIKDFKGDMVLVNVNQETRDFLKVMSFDSLIKIYSSDYHACK